MAEPLCLLAIRVYGSSDALKKKIDGLGSLPVISNDLKLMLQQLLGALEKLIEETRADTSPCPASLSVHLEQCATYCEDRS